jgi:TolB protein
MRLIIAVTAILTFSVFLGGCSKSDAPVTTDEPDAPAQASASAGDEISGTGQELPVWKIPNIPVAAEAYYAPDSFHLIAQTRDPDAQQPDDGSIGGSLTYIFTDDGEFQRRINDRGQDACSYFFPDQERIVWTSTRDNMDMPLGDWGDDKRYPQGAELYISDLEGNNIQRLTNNKWYEAEVSVSPDGEWIVFGRQIDGKMDLWRMRADGTDEQQITFTEDWQEGAPFYLPDNETILYRAWQTSVKDELRQEQAATGMRRSTPMTVFTINHDGSALVQRTFDDDMNWAPYPAPDGRHYVFVRITDDRNWEVFLGDLAGGDPVRLTYYPGFDGLPSLSPDGTKMLFARAGPGGIATYIMDMTSFDLGPDNWQGVPDIETPGG